jgi:hypothetical protein
MNCVVEFETKLKAEGKWEEYQNQIHNSEIDNIINDFRIWSQEEINESNESFVTEAGTVEKWQGGNKKVVEQNIEDSIKFLETLKR